MKKGIITIFAIAIIGLLGIYGKSHSGSRQTSGAGLTPSSQTTPMNTASNGSNESSATNTSASYKDGTYTGNTEDTPYGPVQIAVVVSGGKITNVNFLQMPSDLGHSAEITSFSEPLLKQEAIQKQTPQIDFVSGATVTSEGFEQSLQSALNQAA